MIARSAKLAKLTLKHELAVLRAIFRYAVDRGAIAKDPTRGVKGPRGTSRKLARKKIQIPTRDQLTALIQFLKILDAIPTEPKTTSTQMRTQTVAAKILLTFIASGLAFTVFGQDKRDLIAARKAALAESAKIRSPDVPPLRKAPSLGVRLAASARQEIRAELKEHKAELRKEIATIRPTRYEVKDAVSQARELAREHGRKIADEVKENGNSHRRD